MTDPNAMMRDEAFWQEHRSEQLTKSEDDMEELLRKLQNVKGFKPVLFVAKAFIENFVETSLDPKNPSKVDIGPVNTMISQNFVDGLRLRASAQTTANFNPHLFLKGYVAYGFKDHRWKGLGEVTYSFNKKAYLPREYPVNNLTFSYNRDVMAPSDKFLPTDKDNVFVSFKWTDVEHMMYYEHFRLLWDREWENGFRFKAQLLHSKEEATAALFYQPLSAFHICFCRRKARFFHYLFHLRKQLLKINLFRLLCIITGNGACRIIAFSLTAAVLGCRKLSGI
jgi:hypothetical protein